MKDYPPLNLHAGQDCSSLPTALPFWTFEDWLAERPELWSAGREIQQEMFMQAVQTRAGR